MASRSATDFAPAETPYTVTRSGVAAEPRDILAHPAQRRDLVVQPECAADLFDLPELVLQDMAASIAVARRDDEPIATAMAYESDGVASLQWVGTVPAAAHRRSRRARHRRRDQPGLRGHGASSCSLQASPMGEPVYRRLGYETAYHYSEYVRWPEPPAC